MKPFQFESFQSIMLFDVQKFLQKKEKKKKKKKKDTIDKFCFNFQLGNQF